MAAGFYNGSMITERPTNPAWNHINFGQKAPGNLQANPSWGNVSGQTSLDNPVLPALWWVGLVIILVLVRILSSKYVQ